MLYVPFESSLFSIHFFVLNVDVWFDVLSNTFIIFWYYIILYYYVNLNSTIICSYFSSDIYFSFHISFVFKAFCKDFFKTHVTLSAILLTIISPVVSAVFWIAFSEAVLLHLSHIFLHYLLPNFFQIFPANDKNPWPFTYIQSLGSIESHIFKIARSLNYLR